MGADVGKRVYRVMEIARAMAAKCPDWQVGSRIDEIQIHADGYAEPGYSESSSGLIATGNWNKVDSYNRETNSHDLISDLPARLYDLLTKLGVECEWSDEWSTCDGCNKLVRTSPDSYGWQQSFRVDDDGLTCHECISEDPEAHLLSLENDEFHCNTISSIDPSEHGYVKVTEGETGLHPGQNDDPRRTARVLRAQGKTRFLFNMDDVGQFDAKWSCWVKVETEEVCDDDSN